MIYLILLDSWFLFHFFVNLLRSLTLLHARDWWGLDQWC